MIRSLISRIPERIAFPVMFYGGGLLLLALIGLLLYLL